MAYQQLAARVRGLENDNAALRSALSDRVEPIAEELSTNQIGYMAEQLVKYRAMRQGLNVFDPPKQAPGCDVLIEYQGRFLRGEVKASCRQGVPCRLQALQYAPGLKRERKAYTADQVDVFFLVNLLTEEIWIVPYAAVGSTTAVVMSQTSVYRRFKNNWTFGDIPETGYENKFRPDLAKSGTDEVGQTSDVQAA